MTRIWILSTGWTTLALLLAGIVSAAQAQTITTFDLPSSSFTQPTAINASGELAGIYSDSLGNHGFVRYRNGTTAAFDVHGDDPVGTQLVGVTSMNAEGVVTGYMFLLGRSKYASFERDQEGTVTVVSEPPECLQASQGMNFAGVSSVEGIAFAAINNRGQTTGICGEVPPFDQSFSREPDGTITVFTVPVDGPVITRAEAINSRGQIAGYYYDNGVFRGFLRERAGGTITFGIADSDTTPTAITRDGVITGSAGSHGFVRQTNGCLTIFDVPGSISTQPTAMNRHGEITGFYQDANNTYHGFVRYGSEAISSFDVPNATNTYPAAMNGRGEITGSYSDANGVVHGFLRRPPHAHRRK